MGSGQTLVASFGLDNSGYVAGLKDAVRETNASASQIQGGLGRVAQGSDKIFTSSHRAAHQLTNLAASMASGSSAVDLLAQGLERTAIAAHLPLGPLAIVGLLGLAIKTMHDADQEVIKLNDDIAKLGKTSSSAQFSTLNELETKLEKLKDEAGKLDELSKFGFGFISRSLTGSQGQVEIDKKTVAEQQLATQRGITNKLNQDAYVLELQASGDIAGAKRQQLAIEQEIEMSKLRNGQADLNKIEAVERQQKAARQILDNEIQAREEAEKTAEAKKEEAAAAEKVAAAKKTETDAMHQRERLQFSMEELVARDPTFSNSQSIQAWWSGQQAREVQKLQQQAREEAIGDPGSAIAAATQARGDRLRGGLTELKESERGNAAVEALIATSNSILTTINTGVNGDFGE